MKFLQFVSSKRANILQKQVAFSTKFAKIPRLFLPKIISVYTRLFGTLEYVKSYQTYEKVRFQRIGDEINVLMIFCVKNMPSAVKKGLI